MQYDFLPLLAFSAGMLSFFSPCVLPLIPSYLSILGGVGFNSLNKQSSASSRPHLLGVAIGFILGFSIVLIVFSVLIAVAVHFMAEISRYFTWIGGTVVILLGLNVIFDFLPFLNHGKQGLSKQPHKERKLPNLPRNVGKVAAASIGGAVFAVSWTPCIGPILTGVLFMAGQSGDIGTATFYMTMYSVGLAIPFILVALFFETFLKYTSRIRSFLPIIRRISGVILIVIGLTIIIQPIIGFNFHLHQDHGNNYHLHQPLGPVHHNSNE